MATDPVFAAHLARQGLPQLRRAAATTLQVNVGLRCDLACHHCHVEAGPKRREAMDEALAQQILTVLEASPGVSTLDLTGGAPELSPWFRTLVKGARACGKRVIDRCNLTILSRPGQEDTAAFLAEQGVEVVASLPCYTKKNVEAQRGRFVFDRSLAGLQCLNALGYGAGSLALDLVYNPQGNALPPDQVELEARYRAELRERFGVEFRHLLTITNMPIKRFARQLEREGQLEAYLSLLVNHFNPDTVEALMCRSTLSVGFDGRLYDCDFNQALEIPTSAAASLYEVGDLAELSGRRIATGRHCFGCTAGAGSSCGGALAA